MTKNSNQNGNKLQIKHWLQHLPMLEKLHIVTWLLAIVMLLAIAGMWLGMEALAAMRSYIQAESFWAKSEKDAASSLIKYSLSYEKNDYAAFQNQIKIPVGYRAAREELEKDDPDMNIVYQGFIAGGNHPDDVRRIARTYAIVDGLPFIKDAISAWRQGDELVAQLVARGEELDSIVANVDTAPERAAVIPQVANAIVDIENLNQQLSAQEQRFSASLAAASRQIGIFLFRTLIGIMLIFGIIAIVVSEYINRMVFNIDRTKSEFLSLASHQLRTPLSAMNWYSEKMLRDYSFLKREQHLEYLHEIYSANQRMIGLVEDLLSVSRIELGAVEPTPKPLDVKSALEESLILFQTQLNTKKLVIEKKFDDGNLVANVDPKITAIIFENLLSNAINYTPEGGRIFLEARRTGRNEIICTVKDTGCGIPENEQRNVFSKLFRADNVARLPASGNGLGLYITKALVEKSGGRIWFDSEKDQGSSFYLALPRYSPYAADLS